MAGTYSVVLLGVLFLIAYGEIQPISSQSDNTSKFPTPQNNEDTRPLPDPQHPNQADDPPKKSPTPKIQDQTNRTYEKFQLCIANENDLLASVIADIKGTTISKAKSQLSSIDFAKRDSESIQSGIDGLSSTIDTLYVAAGKRMSTTLLNLGKVLNSSIASFVKTERSLIGQLKLSPDSRTASKELRRMENTLYRALDACLDTFNGSVVSDILNVANTFDTFSMELDTLVNELGNKNNAMLSKNFLERITNYKTLSTSSLNKIPTTTDLNACITKQVSAGKDDLNSIIPSIARPVAINSIIPSQIDMLETDASHLFSNFSTNVQKLINTVTNRIRLVRTFIAKNSKDDPKTIIDSTFKSVTTSDAVTLQQIKTILPRITTAARRMIAPLVTKETAVNSQIIAAFSRSDPHATECDTAIHTINTTKHAFNDSMVACFNSAKDSTSAVLTATLGMINGSMLTFTDQIALTEQFKCGTRCTADTLTNFGQQIRSKLGANKPLLAELRTSVTEQANRIYKAFETCMDGGVKQALTDLNEQSNADLKRCLAVA
nr:uncharacterized protein LOC115255309 [Aedes albopictus]